MLLSLITEHEYHTMRLPDRVEGRYTLNDPKNGNALFEIAAVNGKWIVLETENGRFVHADSLVLAHGILQAVRIGYDLERADLYSEDAGNSYAKYVRCPVQDTVLFTVGTGTSCDFICKTPAISMKHCTLSCVNRKWSVTDHGSKTGTYVNGKRISSTAVSLQPGDVVSVMNQKFILLPGLIVFNAQSLDLGPLKNRFKKIEAVPVPLEHPLGKERPVDYFHRQPRFTRLISEADIRVDAPPSPQNTKDSTPALLTFGPAIASGAAMVLGGMANPIMGASMLASSILFPTMSRKHGEAVKKEEEEKRRKLYSEYLNQLENSLTELERKQADFLRKEIPEPLSEAGLLLQDGKNMWSRRSSHADFLHVRIGTGDIPMKANISFPQEGFSMSDDPMQDLLRNFENKERILKNVPIPMELERFYSIGIAGEKGSRQSFAAQLLGQLVMHCGYDDLKLCLIGPQEDVLSPLKWLPHTWDDKKEIHYTASSREELNHLVLDLDALLDPHRSEGPKSLSENGNVVVVLITDPSLAHLGVLTRLLFDQQYESVHVITLAEQSVLLPSRTDALLQIEKGKGQIIWQDEKGRQSEDFRTDASIAKLLPDMISRMANSYLDLYTESGSMPSSVPFMDLFGVQDVAHLNILSRWDHADPVRTLKTPIGISEDGDLCYLDVHEKADGPHGLMAGTTGAGKSELIMSYILSMAINYSPKDVAFALIDYKGGGMANAFADLPHTVGVITNLDGNALQRSLTSIESENKRRQRVFAEAQNKYGLTKMEIKDYRRLYQEGKVDEPMPHLLIITDEFAELKTQEPEFMAKLISAARVGRSLGIHLILATQQPAGIVDEQIMTNTNFRLCLRMASTQDSQSILKVPDAASITSVGCFYKQVGTVLVKAQSGYSGVEYTPDKNNTPSCGIDVLDHSGTVLKHTSLPRKRNANTVTQAYAVSRYITDLGKQEHISARKLWTPVLEEEIPLAGLYSRYSLDIDPWAPSPVLGEMDDPANQRRVPVRLPLNEGRNCIIYGALGSGKLMSLMTLMEDLLTHHTADQLHIYILDYGDDGLGSFLPAPQVGDVLFSDDEEKLLRLLNMLETEVDKRKKTLGGSLASTPIKDRLRDAGMSNIFVILHRLSTIQEHLGENLERLMRLMKDGPRWGITFLATQETYGGIRFQLRDRFSQSYVLQMDHEDDYSGILGRTGGMKPGHITGRGILKEENIVYEFQVASSGTDASELAEKLRNDWKGKTASAIRVMPEHITADLMYRYLGQSNPLRLPVGLDIGTIEPVYYPFDSRRVHLILGKVGDISSMLEGIIPLAMGNGLPVAILGTDRTYTGTNITTASDAASVNAIIMKMSEKCWEIKKSLDNGIAVTKPQEKLVIIPSMQKLMDMLQEDCRKYLRSMILKARPEWGWTFLICGTVSYFSSLRYSEYDKNWYNGSICKTEGIYLGSGINSQMILQAEGDSRTLNQSISFPFGYVIQNGNAKRIKFVGGEEE